MPFPDTFQKPNKRKLLQVASSGLEPVRPHRLVDRAHLLHWKEVQDALLLTLELLRGVAGVCKPLRPNGWAPRGYPF